jgi:hypothetical protein
MALNKIVLEQDGLAVGNNQLVASGGGITVGQNLVVSGSVYANNLSNSTITNYSEATVNLGNLGGNQTIVFTNGTVFTGNMTSNVCIFTLPNPTPGKSFLLFVNTGAGYSPQSLTITKTISFVGPNPSVVPNIVKWQSGVPPTLTTTAYKTDIFSFVSDGVYWYGSANQNY